LVFHKQLRQSFNSATGGVSTNAGIHHAVVISFFFNFIFKELRPSLLIFNPESSAQAVANNQDARIVCTRVIRIICCGKES